MNKVKESFGSLMVPGNFSAIAPFYKKNQSHSTYSPIANPQTELFCSKLGMFYNICWYYVSVLLKFLFPIFRLWHKFSTVRPRYLADASSIS